MSTQITFPVFFLWSRSHQGFLTRTGNWTSDVRKAKPYRSAAHPKSSVRWDDAHYAIIECTVVGPTEEEMTLLRLS